MKQYIYIKSWKKFYQENYLKIEILVITIKNIIILSHKIKINSEFWIKQKEYCERFK